MYTDVQSYLYGGNCSKQFWQVNFVSVVTVCFHNISKDLNPKPDDNCQTGREQARISFIVMAAELLPGVVVQPPWPGREILYFCSLNFSS